jgi:hypothetical protein
VVRSIVNSFRTEPQRNWRRATAFCWCLRVWRRSRARVRANRSRNSPGLRLAHAVPNSVTMPQAPPIRPPRKDPSAPPRLCAKTVNPTPCPHRQVSSHTGPSSPMICPASPRPRAKTVHDAGPPPTNLAIRYHEHRSRRAQWECGVVTAGPAERPRPTSLDTPPTTDRQPTHPG